MSVTELTKDRVVRPNHGIRVTIKFPSRSRDNSREIRTYERLCREVDDKAAMIPHAVVKWQSSRMDRRDPRSREDAVNWAGPSTP